MSAFIAFFALLNLTFTPYVIKTAMIRCRRGMRKGQVSAVDPLNATDTIENREIKLTDGRAEEEAVPGSATKIETSVFDQPVFGNLDGDGKDDAAMILLHQPGGSGSFYYVVAAMNDNGSWRRTNGVLLGDRTVPEKYADQGRLDRRVLCRPPARRTDD